MKTLQVIAVLTVVVIAAFGLLRRDSDRQSAPGIQGLPWQIETLANGNTRVFGLELTHSTLADARERFGEGMNIGAIAAPGEAGTLEAYFDTVTAGVILVATLDLRRCSSASVNRKSACVSVTGSSTSCIRTRDST